MPCWNVFNRYQRWKRIRCWTKKKKIKLQKNNAEKIFLTTNSLVDAKYTWINRLLYQVIGVINLNEIKNWSEIKKSSTLKSSSLKQKTFETLNFLLELVDENKKNNEFEDSEKNI